MSAIFYRFKAQRQDSRLPIDGTGISVFDLKKEIILTNSMGDGKEFDLGLYDPNGEEYTDDSFIIPRSTSVVVRRLPPSRQGRGTAAMYVAGTSMLDARSSAALAAPRARMGAPVRSITKRFDGKGEEDAPLYPTIQAGPSAGGQDEAAKIAAMFQAEAEQWQETQETMATATPVFSAMRGGRGGGRGGMMGGRAGGHERGGPAPHRDLVAEFSDKPLPPGYICYRCGQRGHWIQLCPTNDDKDFDNKPRFKRTTGIPRSFLKVVEGPAAAEGPGGGVMITPEGGFVIAQPDMATWEKVQQRSKPRFVSEAEIRESAPTDDTLACPICARLFTQAVKTPGSGTAYCEECIQAHLLEHDFTSPDGEKISSLDKLQEDWETRAKVSAYISKEIERRRYDTGESGVEPTPDVPGATQADAATPSAEVKPIIKPVPKGPQAAKEQPTDPPTLIAQLEQLRMMQKLPNLPDHARAKVDQAYHEIAQQLHYRQLVRQMQMQGGGFNAFGQPQPFNPQMLPPPPTVTYGAANSLPSDADARLRLANGRRRGLKRTAGGAAGDAGAAPEDAQESEPAPKALKA